MNKNVATALVESFLQRLVQDGFRLTGAVSQLEQEAILQITGQRVQQHSTSTQMQDEAAPTEMCHNVRSAPWSLDLTCLDVSPDGKAVLGIDFGTAYSKASIWVDGQTRPMLLDLARPATGGRGVLLESTLYIAADGIVYMGPKAIEVSRLEDDPNRRRFDSPKQVLSIAGVEGLSARADADIDPTRSFKNRDLLTLYLAYLTAMICDELTAHSVPRHVVRRFAVPVWSPSQIDETSRKLTQMLIDAQILADTVPIETWRSGIAALDAKTILDELRKSVTDTDERRKKSKLVERHVLEAAAAASAIGDELQNRRPAAVVMDIGAGTTDIGIYLFGFPDSKSGMPRRISAIRGGATARKIAGNRLDDLLLEFIKREAALQDGDAVLFRARRDIREHKQKFFAAGKLRIEGLDDVEFQLPKFLRTEAVQNYRDELKRALLELLKSVGIGNIYREDGMFGVLTGGGSMNPIFRDFFENEFAVDDQRIAFKRLDPKAPWLQEIDPAYAAIFPQLAVATGVSAPNLPDETSPISSVPNSELRVLGLAPVYRS